MQHRYPHLIALAIGLATVGLATRFALGALTHHPKTLAALREAATFATTKPPEKKIRILIVPGHEPDAGGTDNGSLYERDIAIQLGKDLQRFLDDDGRYETVLSRDEHGWNPVISQYFSDHADEINAWQKQARAETSTAIASGAISKPIVHVGHNSAQRDVAVRLYGLTKWANENDIDVMVHIHFDDDRSSTRAAGHRTGFAVFVPPPEYMNGAASKAAAEKIEARLRAFDPTANLPAEASGIVEDPELIAVGEQNTADPASMLIEYAFIYERQLQTPAVRALSMNDMAYQTALGLDDFFFNDGSTKSITSVLPHVWKGPINAAQSDPTDIYALQTALIADGDDPPPGKTKNACSRSGVFDACTRAALALFQKKYGIVGEEGAADAKTLAKIDALY